MLDIFAVFGDKSRGERLKGFANLGYDGIANQNFDGFFGGVGAVDFYVKL